jgi:signal transduction histidine kinase
VRRWLRWSAERSRWWWAPAWPAAAAVGIAAEGSRYSWRELTDWVPDLITGWTLVACGLVAAARRPTSRSGTLLAVTGFAWFVPNFTTTGIAGVDWLAAHALYLHRGPLVALLLTYPGQRSKDRFMRSGLAAGLVLAFASAVWASRVGTLVVAAGLVAFVVGGYAATSGRARRLRLAAVRLTVPVALVLAAIIAVRMAVPTHGATVATLRGYEATLVAVSVAVVVGLLRAPWAWSQLADSVVELGEARSATLRDALAGALGDRSLQVGYWSAVDGQFVDAEGRPVILPTADAQRSVTMVEADAKPLAVLVHDPVFRADEALLKAVAVAARLAARHTGLQRETRRNVVEVTASRRRLVEAADEERRRLERRLRYGAQSRLEQVAETLRAADSTALGVDTVERVARAAGQLARAQDELGRLARGIHPRELDEDGLEAALRSIAQSLAVPVDICVSATDVASDLAACTYFVCSEALTNVVKHAKASRVRIAVRRDQGTVVVAVEDDGIGGADLTKGTGLRGLADRIATLGGTLSLRSSPGGGTRVTATFPGRAAS